MGKFITNWPHGGKWGTCSAAFAAQIAARGHSVMLVDDHVKITRYILHTPLFAQSRLQRHPAVALALRIQGLTR